MTPSEEAKKVAESAELIVTHEQVESTARALGERIAAETQGTELLVLCVMNGGLVTTALVLRHLPNLLQLNYLHASRYRDELKGDALEWNRLPSKGPRGRTVLVVDDIFDEGHTLKAICEFCKEQGAKAVHSAVLVNKVHERKVPGFWPDFIGMDVPDRYIFGEGMDYKGYLRNLSGIYALAE